MATAFHFALPALAEAPAEPSALPTKATGEEQAINLDDIEEAPTGPAKHDGVPDEPLLPVAATSVEVVRTPLLRLTALALVLPVAAMLFGRVRRKRNSLSPVSEINPDE